jgi:hypothetical protein
VKINYHYAVEKFIPLIDKLDFQRSPLRASFYKRLERDIINGCIIPPLTIAINHRHLNPSKINPELIDELLTTAFILDGVQRLSTIARICSENTEFDRNRPLYANILICNSMDRLLYRMVTLNNGQRPMTARHQIEILASNIFDFNTMPILAVTEKEIKRTKQKSASEDVMSKEVLIKGYLAYISSSVNIDNQKIIETKMDELITEQIMDSNLASRDTEFSDVILCIEKYFKSPELNEWFHIPNNFIGFSASMATNFNEIKGVLVEDMTVSIKLFEDAFSSIDISKIKLGLARRRMVQFYFDHFATFSEYTSNQLLNRISQEI